MSAAVAFSYAQWVARYPEFSAVTQPTAQAYFDEAGIYWRNDGFSLCSTTAIQTVLMNMLTAFIAQRYAQSQGDASPGTPKDASTPVGRISAASEGSVNAQFQNDYPPGSPQFFQQNKYGADFWQATAVYRTMRYRRGVLQPGGLGGAGGLLGGVYGGLGTYRRWQP